MLNRIYSGISNRIDLAYHVDARKPTFRRCAIGTLIAAILGFATLSSSYAETAITEDNQFDSSRITLAMAEENNNANGGNNAYDTNSVAVETPSSEIVDTKPIWTKENPMIEGNLHIGFWQ